MVQKVEEGEAEGREAESRPDQGGRLKVER